MNINTRIKSYYDPPIFTDIKVKDIIYFLYNIYQRHICS